MKAKLDVKNLCLCVHMYSTVFKYTELHMNPQTSIHIQCTTIYTCIRTYAPLAIYKTHIREVSMFLKEKDIHRFFCVLIHCSHTLTLGRMMARRSKAQSSSTEASANMLLPHSWGDQQVWGEPGLSPGITGEGCPWGNGDSSSSDSSFLSSSCSCGWTPSSLLAAVSSIDSFAIDPGLCSCSVSLHCGCMAVSGAEAGTSSVIWVHALSRVVLSWRARENASPT